MDILNFISKFIKKRIIFFGTGSLSESIVKIFPLEIDFFIDNDKEKQGQCFENLPILNASILPNLNWEDFAVVIASSYYLEISNQLKEIGLEENIHFFNGEKLFKPYLSGEIIHLEYGINSRPRYGYGKEPHSLLYQMLNKKREEYRHLLKEFNTYINQFVHINNYKTDDISPYWDNNFLPGLDGISLYSMISLMNPRLYFEVGSGNSTKFVHRAIQQNKLETKVLSIDPFPRAEIDILCNDIIRKPLENIDMSIFNSLNKGDILFIDNSHQCFMNSDVTVFFLEILPNLSPGVIVAIHDICLPYDYPPDWVERYYSEQYLLACYLLAQGNTFEVLLPNAFISHDDELMDMIGPIFSKIPHVSKYGSLFWLVKR